MSSFDGFIGQIPQEILKRVKSYVNSNLAVFIPELFLYNTQILDDNYHVMLTTSAPPPSIFGKKTYEFKANRMIVINPNTRFIATQTAKTGEYISVAIKKEFVSKVARSLGIEKEIEFTSIDNPFPERINKIFKDLEFETLMCEKSSSLIMDSVGVQLVAEVIRNVDSNVHKKSLILPDNKDFVKKAIDYIEANYVSNLSIEDICKEIYVTPYHFIRVFKDTTGMTPHEYILKVRLEKARNLLKSDVINVSQAASLCGFVNTAHFSAVFKKRYGITPLQQKKSVDF